MNPPDMRSEGFPEPMMELLRKYVLGGIVHPLPSGMESIEIGRVTMTMFYFGAYKLLFPEKPLKDVVNVDAVSKYLLETLRVKSNDPSVFNGFTGCEVFGSFKQGHISYTYAALASLSQLGYDLRRIDKTSITSTIPNLFKPGNKGVFATSLPDECEHDVRFVYSLCAVCYLLNDWSFVDKTKLFDFIMSCRSYDFAFGQVPLRESHGGSTFCAIQSISLMGMLDKLTYVDELVQWLVQKSYLGFSGRINKPADTCYTYWIGATLKTLGCEALIDKKFVLAFVESCVSKKYGGVSKNGDSIPDPMHTFCSLTGLSLIGALPVSYVIDSRIGIERPSYLSN
ncbi:geranylgeranyl transferase type-1 subunit beta, putative [Entamoeba invadens IP1]|uniref:Geranylgeranyl transferase type-1 subunit beta, putative n=2 Tax=Entamoeba invadens TaxID=33085 RepID=A0A0A1U2N3_ENTIV|nr:geranylgeranyl transferase type-1 subunit beta, putative [Entamoeba invadens IP1]ELP88317.1 geranylgeranyl transferase type-1 subunit beta, putative [Entamoeba invadens IP1]BAN42075.1 geranylgeranyl transferase type-1 subunit beta, putative [Entamoeba invadens]|eukprot:XP_004255088.1 geranylgeranyl transferase type-1 subunit beta, putative [Entamoeba invadens IP1]